MARQWLRWMHHENMKAWIVPSLLLASVWMKWAVGLGSYSGQSTTPLYGDYEAQRHWMELTIHLPIRQWYKYDLQYWGLDYPPLTAYVSWLCGIVGSWIEPSWFALDESRGIESPESKVYMRSTVLAFDTLIYVPALVMFTRVWQGSRSSRTQNFALFVLLFQPALSIIDFGHFQYNSVMLGFMLLAMNFFAIEQDLLGAVCFVLSLGFKQMSLYYAPAIGTYLLAKCVYLGPSDGAKLFVRLGAVTAASFVVLFLPWLPPFAPLSAILDPITRIFPFGRGLFEDKVANFWCASNVVLKWKLWAAQGVLIKLSTALTALGFSPAVATLLLSGYRLQQAATAEKDKTSSKHTPLLPLLPYALLTSSLSFFLFSFQVHEKTILVPLLPMTLLMSGASPDEHTFELGMLMNNVAMFSMWPLLKRDGQGVEYVALLVLWNMVIGYNPFSRPTRSYLRMLSVATYSATPVFMLVCFGSIKRGIEVSWAVGGLGSSSRPKSATATRHKPAVPSVSASTPASAVELTFPTFGQDMDDNLREQGGMRTRSSGMRTMSLGFAQGRKRKVNPPTRTSSVDITQEQVFQPSTGS